MPEKHPQTRAPKVRRFLRLDKLPPFARKIVVIVVGGLLVLAGVVMLVTPGPGLILIPLGLFVLGFEFKWAEAATQKVIELFQRLRQKWEDRRQPRHL